MIEILRTGPLATIQDLGRPGWARLGVGRSGAADRGALALGNRLLGNDASAAGIEVTFGGLSVRLHRPALVALTGAPCPVATDAPPGLGFGMACSVPAGATLTLGPPTSGVRSYLCVRGGVDVPPVLGSRSTDVLSGLGPPVLLSGAELPIGDDPGTPVSPGVLAPPRPPSTAPLRVLPGPRDDWSSIDRLLATGFVVDPTSDRIGVRLRGDPLPRRAGELPPEGMVRGGLQVPPDGQPVLLLADHPVTGGYPVIAVVVDLDLDRTAQLRPGDPVRFALAPGLR